MVYFRITALTALLILGALCPATVALPIPRGFSRRGETDISSNAMLRGRNVPASSSVPVARSEPSLGDDRIVSVVDDRDLLYEDSDLDSLNNIADYDSLGLSSPVVTGPEGPTDDTMPTSDFDIDSIASEIAEESGSMPSSPPSSLPAEPVLLVARGDLTIDVKYKHEGDGTSSKFEDAISNLMTEKNHALGISRSIKANLKNGFDSSNTNASSIPFEFDIKDDHYTGNAQVDGPGWIKNSDGKELE
ncbi:hypothetical protein EV361DRAFT_212948 [Lentinula raphanica]|nr:hypothetical protein EV360DRAFT_70656 [Lentinula raphanica]KAJ3772820.1 hypothetical protein FB446DRAFT_33412 [Lentinula raphanica]KAJ3821615.1 hypothetical protein F5880DRAFT_800996 [Lentinula raphanica]KAJ3971570.1 hypothetical protein EV361DRAFT_212948 [Lentinula raphanica]